MSESGLDLEVRYVLGDMVEYIKYTARNLEMALMEETVDAFHKYTKKAQEQLELLLKYIEDNPKKVSAAMRRPELRKAQEALRDALSCIRESVDTLEDPPGRDSLYYVIDRTIRRLKGG